jgi:hypothetical protein
MALGVVALCGPLPDILSKAVSGDVAKQIVRRWLRPISLAWVDLGALGLKWVKTGGGGRG